jgi:hypothetical protein
MNTETVFAVVSVGNGTPTFSYQWSVDGSSVSGATSASYSFVGISVGNHTVSVTVTDSANADSVPTTSPSITVTVQSLYNTFASANGYLAKIAKSVS